MRWKLPPKPKLGDRRVVKKFAWTPYVTSDRVKVWLERYVREEQYDSGYGDYYWKLLRSSDIPTYVALRLQGKA